MNLGGSRMSKAGFGLLIAVLAIGNVVSLAWILTREPDRRVVAPPVDDAAADRLAAAIDGINERLDQLSASLDTRAVSAAADAFVGETAERAASAPAPARSDAAVLARLDAIDETLQTMRDTTAEIAAAQLREERKQQFRTENGFAAADELLAEKQFSLAASGYLEFLEHHPDHPDARDIMQKARDAFRRGGYGDKALWLHEQMMEKYPAHRGEDLYALALMEKQSGKLDSAIERMDESVSLAENPSRRMWRLHYRAYLFHQRDGDVAGLDAYREVEKLARAAGVDDVAKNAKQRADGIQKRLAEG